MQTKCIDMNFKDLADLSGRLNASTDQLNTELQAIEERINALSLGVEGWVTKRPLEQEFTNEWAALAKNAVAPSATLGHSTRSRTATELGYARFSEGWKLAVRTVTYPQARTPGSVEWEEPVDVAGAGEICRETKPLLRASRTLRMRAVDQIPDLIDALHAAATQVAEAVEKARKISDSLK
jgi:uncharacterized protein YukE